MQLVDHPGKARLGLGQIAGCDTDAAEIEVGRDRERAITGALGHRQRCGQPLQRLLGPAELPQAGPLENANPTLACRIVQLRCQALRVPQMRQDRLAAAERPQGVAQFEAEIDRPLQGRLGPRQIGRDPERMLELGSRLVQRGAVHGLAAGQLQIAEGLVPLLGLAGVVRQRVDPFDRAWPGLGFDQLDDPGMQLLAAAQQNSAVSSILNQRMLEGVARVLSLAAPDDQARLGQTLEIRRKRGGRPFEQGSQQLLPELAPDDRADLGGCLGIA